MDDHTLHYGHLGSLAYNEAERAWACQRLPVQRPTLTIIREDFCITGNTPSDDISAHHHSTTSRYLQKESRHLADSIPSFAGAVRLVEALAKADQWTDVSPGRTQQLGTGNLLAFGSSYGFQSATRDPASIVAYVQGPNIDQLWIAQLRPTTRHSDSDASGSGIPLLRPVPSIHPTWHCPTGQILQVSFSGSVEDRHTLLVVRSSTRIYIFRPLLITQPAKGSSGWKWAHAHSVAANQVLEIRIAAILSSSCADVVFNPWFQWQLVAIDDRGCFAVFDISNKQKLSGRRHSKVVAQGKVEELPNTPDKKGGQPCRVLWLHNVHMFLATCRQKTAVFDTRNTSVYLTALDVREDIVDIAQSPRDKDEIFILTTGQVKWIRVVTLNNETVTIQTICTWRHYFDAFGADFRLAFRGSDEDAAGFLIVYSRKAFLMAEYTLGGADGGDPDSWHVTSPASLRKHASLGSLGHEGMLSLHISQVFAGAEFDNATETRDYFQLFVLDNNMTLASYTCSATASDNDNQIGSGRRGNPPFNSWQRRIRSLIKDDWLVDDDTSSASGLDNEATRLEEFQEDETVAFEGGTTQPMTKGVPNAKIYEAITAREDHDRLDLVTQVGQMLTDMDESRHMEYVLDTSNEVFTIHDLESAEEYVKSLISHVSPSGVNVGRLAICENRQPSSLSVAVLCRNGGGPQSLSATYDRIIAAWMGSLSTQVSARTRVRLERIARSMTASIWLATHRIEDTAADSSQPSQNATSYAPPSQHGLVSSDTTSSQAPLPSSQPLPEAASSTQDSDIQGEFNSPDAAATRLAKYTSVSNPPLATTLTDSILSHWTDGADPATYDFNAETARLTGTLNVAGSQMSAEVYARQKRRAAIQEERRQLRLAKRLRTSVGGSSVPGSSQTQVPFSQPGPGSEQLWQSSQPTSQQGALSQGILPLLDGTNVDSQTSQVVQVASQIQPGRHGGRPLPGSLAMRIKGKRKAGF